MNSYNPFSLQNKTILITGASSGIGKAVAVECAKLGARCVLTARNNERLQQTLSELEGVGHSCMVADLTNEEELEKIVLNLPILDGIVYAAGIMRLLPISFLTQKHIETQHEINLMVPMLLTRLLLKNKKLNKGASLVYTSSANGVYRVSLGNAIYASSKSGLDAFVKTAALELASYGIRCNTVNPGMVETELLSGFSEEQLIKERQKYPLGRFATSLDIAWAIIYLLSDAASWVTGTELKIDGGRTLS